MHTKAKLATILRRLADRLAPAPAGDCGSGSTWINYSLDVPAGVTSIRPGIDTGTYGNGGLIFNADFEQGEGWTPA